MDEIYNRYFLPEYERTQERLPGLEADFLARLNAPTDYSGLRGELEALAQGVSAEIFRPGGQFDMATRSAADQSVETGFGTSSGGFDRARLNIARGAESTISNAISQGAMQIAPIALQQRQGDIASAFGLLGLQSGRADDLRESLFGIKGSIEQLKLAKEQMRQNERLVNAGLKNQGGGAGGFFRGAAGGAAGGFMVGGPPGALIGGVLGGLGGLF